VQQSSDSRIKARMGIFKEQGHLLTSGTCSSQGLKKCLEVSSIGLKEGSLRTLEEISKYEMSMGRVDKLFSLIRLEANSNRGLGKADLKAEAESAISLGHYRDAVRCLTLAIDKIEVEKSFFPEKILSLDGLETFLQGRAETTNEMKLAELYQRRVWCLMKACESRRITNVSLLKYSTSIVQDCAFLLRTGLFNDEIQKGTEIYNQLVEIESKALATKG
jgi:hypothetical protein